MGRYDFADSLLQILNFVAWVASLILLVLAALLWGQGLGMEAAVLAIAAVLFTVSALALGHVGRAVIDMARVAATLPLQATSPAAPSPTAQARPAPGPTLVQAPHDERRWRYLKEADDEVAAAAARMAAFGAGFEAQLAERYLLLGDRAYLPAIERRLAAAAQEAAAQAMDGVAAIRRQVEERALRLYREAVEQAGGVDPGARRSVLDVQPYDGSWRMFRGGVKARLDDGSWVLSKDHVSRHFPGDPDA